jgi:hypothetical protein
MRFKILSGILAFLLVTVVLSGCKGSPEEPSKPSPTVTSISPTSGPISGGTLVTITGSSFVAGVIVTFGGAGATGVNVASATSITATTPSHAAGVVDVVVSLAGVWTSQLTGGFTYEEESRIKLGLWEGTLPSAPAGSGRLSFRVTSPTSLTFLSTKVPTFSNMSGCSETWDQVVTINSDCTFSAKLTKSNTSLTYEGKFDSDILATGTVLGTCKGGLVLLGQTFRASWVSN